MARGRRSDIIHARIPDELLVSARFLLTSGDTLSEFVTQAITHSIQCQEFILSFLDGSMRRQMGNLKR